MLVMSQTLSSAGEQLWLLLTDDVVDDATSTRWDSEVQQLRKKKSPQGVEELMIYIDRKTRWGKELTEILKTHSTAQIEEEIHIFSMNASTIANIFSI